MNWWKTLQNKLHPPPPPRRSRRRPPTFDPPPEPLQPLLDSTPSSPRASSPSPPPPRPNRQWDRKDDWSSEHRMPPLHAFLHRWYWWILTLLFVGAFCTLVGSVMSMGSVTGKMRKVQGAEGEAWRMLGRVQGYWRGVRDVVPVAESGEVPSGLDKGSGGGDEAGFEDPKRNSTAGPGSEPEMKVFNPYPDYASKGYRERWPEGSYVPCGFGGREVPEVRAIAGAPRGAPDPTVGSADVLGIDNSVCFERYGRYGGYGLGYAAQLGGLGVAIPRNSSLVQQRIDYRNINWGVLQKNCTRLNAARFQPAPEHVPGRLTLPLVEPAVEFDHSGSKRYHPRTAVLLRAYSGFRYTPDVTAFIRSLVAELSLRSGGEYEVRILLHVKDGSVPIFSSPELYRRTLESSGLPAEFWDMAELWNEPLMATVYSSLRDTSAKWQTGRLAADQLYRALPIHGVYRSTFMPVQLWSLRHPEFDFVWNIEMDVRYTGHWYHLLSRLHSFAREHSPGDAENENFLVPALRNYTAPKDPDRRDADLITLNPLFDPANTTWILRDDHTGYPRPPPPRRAAIVTTARLSRRLLRKMHALNLEGRAMFSEMFPASVARFESDADGAFKTVYAPHPVWNERAWPPGWVEKWWNGKGEEAVWGEREAMLETGSWGYRARFGAEVYRAWAGMEGGMGDGERLCLRGGWLVHPVKSEEEGEV